jgi:FkbM family methyltransferase
VVELNEYRLPDRFQPEDIIIDIGMHIGCFSYAVLIRGTTHVFGFEPDPDNFAWATRNMKSFAGRITLQQKAVWRSDRQVDKLFLVRDATNTGSSTTYGDSGEHVGVIPFDTGS